MSLRLMLTVLALITVTSDLYAQQGPFDTMLSDHWAFEAVAELQSNDIFAQMPLSCFGDERKTPTTRYEFAITIARALSELGVLNMSTGQLPSETSTRNQKNGYHFEALSTCVDAMRRLVEEFSPELHALGISGTETLKMLGKWKATLDFTTESNRRIRYTYGVDVISYLGCSYGLHVGQPYISALNEPRRKQMQSGVYGKALLSAYAIDSSISTSTNKIDYMKWIRM